MWLQTNGSNMTNGMRAWYAMNGIECVIAEVRHGAMNGKKLSVI